MQYGLFDVDIYHQTQRVLYLPQYHVKLPSAGEDFQLPLHALLQTLGIVPLIVVSIVENGYGRFRSSLIGLV